MFKDAISSQKGGEVLLIPYTELERWMKEAEEQRLEDEKFKTRRNRLILQAKESAAGLEA